MILCLAPFFVLVSTGIVGAVKNSRSGMGSIDVFKSLVHAGGRKSDKNNKKDDICLADGMDLTLSDTCGVGQGVTPVDVSYEYFLIIDNEDEDEDDVDHIISCNEVTLHQALVGNFCPSNEDEPKAKSGKKDGGSIVVSISSLPGMTLRTIRHRAQTLSNFVTMNHVRQLPED